LRVNNFAMVNFARHLMLYGFSMCVCVVECVVIGFVTGNVVAGMVNIWGSAVANQY